MQKFARALEVGKVWCNCYYLWPSHTSFGGWKNSLFGDSHAHGIEGVHFFTRTKAVTRRWPDPSHRGLQLGFPQNS